MTAPGKAKTAPVRIWNTDGTEVIAQGEVPVSMLRNPDRQQLLKALQPPKRAPMSQEDVMGDLLRASQKRSRAVTLADLQARVENIEARLGIGRKPQQGYFPPELTPPPAA